MLMGGPGVSKLPLRGPWVLRGDFNRDFNEDIYIYILEATRALRARSLHFHIHLIK